MAEHDLRGREVRNDMTHCALAIEQLLHHSPACASFAPQANDDRCSSALRLIANDDWGRSSGAAAGGCGGQRVHEMTVKSCRGQSLKKTKSHGVDAFEFRVRVRDALAGR